MPDLREEILGSGINKKRIIGIAIVTILLIAIFAFSTVFISFLFGTQRIYPSREKAETPYEDADLILPDYPFDEDFWQDLLDQVDDPASLLDMLSEMFDGDIDDLDLGNFSQGLLDLLYSGAGEIEVFRVYDYISFSNMSEVLWKFECFDEYTGEGWTSNAGENLYDFYLYGDYLYNFFPDPELLMLKMPISPEIGSNSMVLPTLFPTPFVIDGSISAPNLDPSPPQLYKDDHNCTTIDLSFSTNEDTNMTFNMFGFYNHLPSPIELNNTAVKASYTPLYIQNKYLQLPPTITLYKQNHPYFDSHFNILNGMINPNDNAFWVANKIRNYLQTQFSFPLSPDDYNPAPDGTDVVEWFCETEQGLWSDFASAFCAFARAFDISCRFVDGFNSFMIEEFLDNDEGKLGFAVKYKNLYNWAEIYVPTDLSGNGEWVQFDIFDSFGGGGSPIIGGNYNITVSTNQTTYIRPDTADITAVVSSNTDPINNLTITFRDYTTGRILGQDNTDLSGIASIQTDFDSSELVGPHLIEARYDFFTSSYNLTTILGDISIALTGVNPGELNVSDLQPDTTNIVGYTYDPSNGERVEGPELNIRLFEKGNSIEIPGAFDPSAINTTNNGIFDDYLDLIYTSAGNYEIRADLNGSWYIDTPLGKYPYSLLSFIFQVPYIYFTNSSNRLEFNITKDLDVWFSINGVPSTYPNTPPNYPIVSRYQDLTLSAKVVSVTSGPISNRRVYFHDYSRGDLLLGSDISDANGFASIIYHVGDYCVAGPNLLYARVGLQQNYSYFILDEIPTINILSGPTPRIINRTGAGDTQFNVIGEIFDSTNNSLPISYSKISLILLKNGVNYSSYLVPFNIYPYQTGSTGYFDLNFGVAPNTPPGNYSLRLDFNGTITLSTYPYSYQFSLPFISTSIYFVNELQIDAPATLDFNFWINGTTSDDVYSPIIDRNSYLNLTADIKYDGIPIANGEWVYFFDVTDNIPIGSAQTTLGRAEVIYSTNESTTAGPHLIYATWNGKFNYSYFILNAPVELNLDLCPEPAVVNRSGTIGRNFAIHGYLVDRNNGNPIKYGEINIFMYDGITEVTFYLNLESGSLQLGTSGEIDLIYSVSSSTPVKNYTLIVEFNGIFIYTDPNYPQWFDLSYITNFTNTVPGLKDLRVADPDDVSIYFFIDGNPTLTIYDDYNLPQRYLGTESINFSTYVTQSGIAVTIGSVTFIDVYTGISLGTGSINDGFASILANTISWHGGLHQISAKWSGSDTINTTYVIINKTVNIFSYVDKISIVRNIDSFLVSGTVRENGEFLRGLKLNITLLDNTFMDVSGYLFDQDRSLTINNDGSYQFSNSIKMSCPQGQYYLRIDFNGSISAPGIVLSDYMVHNSSSIILLNVNAGTNIIQDSWYTEYDSTYPEYSHLWIVNDTLYVIGTLTWDNGSVISNMYVNVTIKLLDGTVIAFNDTVQTDNFGVFNVSIFISEYDNWPEFRDQSEIWVYFDPVINGVQYADGSEQEFN
jgi:hypothetical protein